jgi:hypothetical protein
MPYNVRDGLMNATIALPAAAGAVHTPVIDLGAPSADGAPATDFVAQCELLVTAPALDTTQLPDTTTAIYEVEQSANGTSNFTALTAALITQTGADGAGAAAATARLRLPTNVQRYIRVTVTTANVGEADAGDCSGASVLAEMLF